MLPPARRRLSCLELDERPWVHEAMAYHVFSGILAACQGGNPLAPTIAAAFLGRYIDWFASKRPRYCAVQILPSEFGPPIRLMHAWLGRVTLRGPLSGCAASGCLLYNSLSIPVVAIAAASRSRARGRGDRVAAREPDALPRAPRERGGASARRGARPPGIVRPRH
jgi:hypothetical protein